jgi:hypothetical protein
VKDAKSIPSSTIPPVIGADSAGQNGGLTEWESPMKKKRGRTMMNASKTYDRNSEIARIRQENPMCHDAIEKFGAMPIEEARLRYPWFFMAEDEWRLPTKDDTPTMKKFLDQVEAIYVEATGTIS